MDSTEFVTIDTAESLKEALSALSQVSVIAIDTEFARFNTYYPIVGLIQIFDGSQCYLIDPVAIEDIHPLGELLANEKILKVLHAGSEDMEVFQHSLRVLPRPIYDTQIAGAVLGIGFSMGYQGMVEEYLSITLQKDQTRSDWLARPLSAEQLNYAALDVIHLLAVYHEQMQQLNDGPKLAWIDTESAELGRNMPTTISPDESYKKFKGLWQLDRNQLNLLQALCAWREETARKEDVPRNRVVDQKALMIIVREGLADKQAFQNEAGLLPRQVRKFGDDLLLVQAESAKVSIDDCPGTVERTDTPVNNNKLKLLRQVVDDKAKQWSVAPEMLTKRRHLEKLIRSGKESGNYSLPLELSGWREAVVGEALLLALTE